MLLSITTTYPPASDLGDLLHKRPAASTNGHERPQAPTTRCPSVFESHSDSRVGKLDSPSCNTASHRLLMPTHYIEAQTNRPR